MELYLPKHIKQVINILNQAGYEAFAVGGCVRDQIMKRMVHDYDITSSATPKQMMHLFEGIFPIIPTGLTHGTITLIVNHEAVEITTFRIDKEYVNHRIPQQVEFTPSLLEDLKRRDFTINAIAYHPDVGIIDPFHGILDIQNKIVRCVGDAMQRFDEDALRMMRALRFAHTLHFNLEDNTHLAILKLHHLLSFVSKERIREEFSKILMSDEKDLLIFMQEVSLLEEVLPEMLQMIDFDQNNPWHIYDLFHHTQCALNHSDHYPLSAKLSILLHDIGKCETKTTDEKGISHFFGHAQRSAEIAYDILKRLTYDCKTIHRCCTIITYHDYQLSDDERIIKRFLRKLNDDFDLAKEIIFVQIADDSAKNPIFAQEKIAMLTNALEILENLQRTHSYISLKDLAVDGNDLIEAGYQGKEIGIILHNMLEYVIDQPQNNTKEYLLQHIWDYTSKNTTHND